MYQRKRAPKGYGKPFQDARGYWNIQIANGEKRGRTVYKRIRCKTIEGLRAKQKDFEAKVARGQRVGKGVPTVAAFLRQWIDLSVKTRNRYSTHRRYAQIVEQYLIPWLDPRGTRKLDELDRTHVQQMINELAQSDPPKRPKALAPRSLRNIRSVLRRALKVAMDDGLILRNVAKMVDLPAEPNDDKRTLTTVEARWFMDAVAGSWQRALYWTALLMGFREGELCGFRLTDLDMERGILHPHHGIQRQKEEGETGKLVAIELKTKASREPLTIPSPLIPILREHLDKLGEARGQSTWTEHGMLFPSTVGTPQEPRNLARQFQGIIKAWNKARPAQTIPTIPFHNLRHTCGTLLAEMGVHPRVIQAVLRHASYYTTMKFYVHSREATEAAAVEGLGAMLVDTDRILELPPKAPIDRA